MERLCKRYAALAAEPRCTSDFNSTKLLDTDHTLAHTVSELYNHPNGDPNGVGVAPFVRVLVFSKLTLTQQLVRSRSMKSGLIRGSAALSVLKDTCLCSWRDRQYSGA
jgi:hypothetical protein